MRPLLLMLLLASASAGAADFRSVGEPGTIFYDAPAVKGKKLFVVSRDYPVEVLLTNDAWARVRDASGELAWVERKALSERRTVVVTAPVADVRNGPTDQSGLAFRVEKGVALELVEGASSGPWARVRLRDGRSGFTRSNALWGL